MNQLCINTLENIYIYLEEPDVIQLSLVNKSHIYNLNESNFIKIKVNNYRLNKYRINKSIPIIYNYYKLFNNNCYICKHNNKIKLMYYQKEPVYKYNICHHCKSKNIHISEMKYGYKTIQCNNYPFYDLSEYLKMIRDNKLVIMISSFNKRKLELEYELRNKNMVIPEHSKLCKNYILGRTSIKLKAIISILCKNKYLYEYTLYNHYKKHFYYNDYLTWKQSEYYAKKMVLINNTYPCNYPWE